MNARTLVGVSLALMLSACSSDDTEAAAPESPKPASMMFHGMVGMADAACGVDLSAGTGSTPVQLADARLFVSNLELRNAAGEWVSLELEQDTPWQHEGVALLDFEDGSGACADSGTADMNHMVEGQVAAGSYDALRFDVGVPFSMNHVDSATAPSPLSAPGMFWTWQGGYKFVRVDFAVDGGASRFNVHVGSTGCAAASPTDAPQAPCAKPNLATVQIDNYSVGDPVMVNLLQLVAGSDVTVNTVDSPPGCMSNPAEPDDCMPVFQSLGLDFATGACVGGCASQAVFSGSM